MGEMASMLSHELNQPLAAISSYATGTANMIASPHQATMQDVSHALARIAEQAERAGKVIKSVHDFVRRRESKHECVAVKSLLDAVMPLIQLQAQKCSVHVALDVPSSLPSVLVDRVMVEQVVLNLARNGIQAMVNVGASARVLRIQVQVSRSNPSWLEFRVTDSGHGIDDATAQQLFTPFFSTKSDGMGLGLSLCRTVVEQHGGSLSFERHLPQGTAFVFTLPVATTDTAR
jgi:two-component system sensor histidine kinase DctS